MKFSAKANFSGPLKMFKDISDKHIPAARTAALNRAASATQTAVVRNLQTTEKIKQRIARRRIRFEIRDRATKDRAFSKLFLVTSPLPVSYLGRVSQGKTGTTAGGMFYPHAFMAKMKSGHVGVYTRQPGAKKKSSYTGKTSLLPIKEIRKRLQHDLAKVTLDEANKTGIQVFKDRFRHELSYRLGLLSK